MLIVANHFLETEPEKLRAAVSMGYARAKLSRDRKDWYDWDADRCQLSGEDRKSPADVQNGANDP